MILEEIWKRDESQPTRAQVMKKIRAAFPTLGQWQSYSEKTNMSPRYVKLWNVTVKGEHISLADAHKLAKKIEKWAKDNDIEGVNVLADETPKDPYKRNWGGVSLHIGFDKRIYGA